MTTVREIAKQLGISGATVSRALNDHSGISAETKARVLEAARAVGYTSTVGKRATNVISLVYPSDPIRPDLGGFESAIIAGILRAANQSGFDLTIINFGQDRNEREDYTQFFRRKGVSGALLRTITPGDSIAEQVTAEGFPCVLIADQSENASVSFVDSASRASSQQAVEHMIAHGHKRIALGQHSVRDPDHCDRERGYVDALQAAGIERLPELTITGPAGHHTGALMIDHLMRLDEPPTAIYFTDPFTTVGALNRCLALGLRVPEDLSIVGFDDGEYRLHTYPNFSAVCQDAHTMAADATRWLIRNINGETSDGPIRMIQDTRFSVHGTTGFCPRSTPTRLQAPVNARRSGSGLTSTRP